MPSKRVKYAPEISCAGHLRTALRPEHNSYVVKRILQMIKAKRLKFDAIACRGLSGFLIAPIVAMHLGKTLICVRKDTSDTHSNYLVEGDRAAGRYLILDDFISGGGTVRSIVSEINNFNGGATCIGFIAYKRLLYENSLKFAMESAWWDGEDLDGLFPDKKLRKCVEG